MSATAQSPFEQGVATLLADEPAGGPAWLADLRRAGADALQAAGLPTPRHEDWRFTNLAALAPLTFGRASGPGPEELLGGLPPQAGPRLVFSNGRLRRDLSSGGTLAQGAIVAPLAEALLEAPELVRPHLGRLARPEGLFFTALNAALLGDGAFVYLPAGAQLAEPIELVFAGGGAGGPVVHPPRVLL
ncbi:MAG TPA: Fe-S cluster assembly protein SufD, partial [Anaeromyxobacter sp.]|nr:Fe-S cluster assembly protein SufD [Anaeromyxobacter sp.]